MNDKDICIQKKTIQNKCCQVCGQKNRDTQMYLCERCDDGYHISCLPQYHRYRKPWICTVCERQEIQQNVQKTLNCYAKKCYLCQIKLQSYEVIEIYNSNQSVQAVHYQEIQPIECYNCKEIFHKQCFSRRRNSLNCEQCQGAIRSTKLFKIEQMPKSHSKFMEYLKQQLRQVTLSKKHILQSAQPWNQYQQRRQIGLVVANPPQSWQTITKYQASLYYALKSSKKHYTNHQIYADKVTMQLNDPIVENVTRIALSDEMAFQQYLTLAQNGIFPPLQIKQSHDKGFYVIASEKIQKFTILCEYVGEVLNTRQSLKHINNNSIFMLVYASRSCQCLDIVPNQYGNICQMFSGVNNNIKPLSKLVNVKGLRFQYKGRVRLIFYTIKSVFVDEELYLDYNWGNFQEYPTDQFVK